MSKNTCSIRNLFGTLLIAGGAAYAVDDYLSTPHSVDDLALNLVNNHILGNMPELEEKRLLMGFLTSTFIRQTDAATCTNYGFYTRCALKDEARYLVKSFLFQVPNINPSEENEAPGEKPRAPSLKPSRSWNI
ncbi:MAG: hypothetical protein DI626_03670 [Micavibrio aeruginosavorus]|uniref:Uncharacterized protein n=1 Tax=Micavibrio aeruginosavorus TaxID=349221 RepID=A0A2W5A542_9BACT|nr:MAG: hypothetical protein DI626_03670 [Micavibrio aeruginosavorus]